MPQLFEYATVAMSTLDFLNTPELLVEWSEGKEWRSLAPHQQLRHRRCDKVLYLGSGYTSILYKEFTHENLNLMPGWFG